MSSFFADESGMCTFIGIALACFESVGFQMKSLPTFEQTRVHRFKTFIVEIFVLRVFHR